MTALIEARPLIEAHPQITRPVAGTIWISPRARVDLPEPLSPTMPRVSPALTVKFTPATACRAKGLVHGMSPSRLR